MPPGSTLEQSEEIVRQIGAILDNSPVVETAFYDVEVGGGNAFITLKKERPVTSVEWERSLQPKLAAIPDARVTFQSQSGGFSRSEERRVGKECVSTCRSRWSPSH